MMNIHNVYVSGALVPVSYANDPAISIGHSDDLRTTCDFVIQDSTGLALYHEKEPVEVYNPNGVLRFRGYIDKVNYDNQFPSRENQISISCVDVSDLASRKKARRDYQGQLAGDMFADMVNVGLSSVGVVGQYAIRRDSSKRQFGLGTLTGVDATNNIDDGDLELSSAGTTVTIEQTTTSDFSTGTLTDLVAASNQLTIDTTPCMHLHGVGSQGINNIYVYYKIYQQSGTLTITSGDVLVYDIWISSTSPKITGGLDLTTTDNINLRDTSGQDQDGLASHPVTDLSGYANDQWYTRSIGLNDIVGKNLSYATIAQEGDDDGTYDFYVSQAYIKNSSGTVRATLFNTSLSRVPTLVRNTGYSSLVMEATTAYSAATGTRQTASLDISDAGIVRGSIVSWEQNKANKTDSDATPYVEVESSIDGGATWQACTNHGAIPHLLPGLSATSVLIRQILNIADPDPRNAPALTRFALSVQPSYASSVVSLTKAFTGTGIGTSYDSQNHSDTMTDALDDLTINGNLRNWRTDPNRFTGVTLYGGGVVDGVEQPNSAYGIRCDPSSDGRSRQDWAGQWDDCIIEVDIFLPDTVGNYGVCWRCTNFSNTNDTYAYNAFITATAIQFGRGNNSSGGTGAFTSISSVALTLQTNQWYHMRVETFGSSHKIYLNDTLYITSTDTTYSARGYVMLRHFNNSAARHTGVFQNFGVLVDSSGTWTTNNISLNALGTIGNSLITWDSDVPSNTTLNVQTSINAGSTWSDCVKDGMIPLLPAGTSVTGKNLLIRAQIATQNANATSRIHGLSVTLTSAFSASGNRISPALSLNNVGVAGDTSINWNAVVPSGTTLLVDSSLDGSSWNNVGSGGSGSAVISGITTQPDPFDDPFDVDTSSLYTQTTRTGGSSATWTWNTASSQLSVSGGTNGQLLETSASVQDGSITADTDTSDGLALIWRRTGAGTFYELDIFDSASSQGATNALKLYKVVANTKTQLGTTTTVDFTRGRPRRIQAQMVGSAITIIFDGTQVISLSDTSITASGGIGLASLGGSANVYQLRIQQFGQSVTGMNAYTRTRLTSTDPTVSPQLKDITMSCRSPQIESGALIPEARYSVLADNDFTYSDAFDDLIGKSVNMVWGIDFGYIPFFRSRYAQLAPWCVTSDDMLATAIPSLQTSGQDYRDTQFITGGVDTIDLSESFIGDGFTQTWSVRYPIQSVSSITVNGIPAMVGQKDQDTGKDFYYEAGSQQFYQDASLSPLDSSQVVTISFSGQANVSIEMRDDSQIAEIASYDHTDGIIEASESCNGLQLEAMLQTGQSRLQQYAVIVHTLGFSTLRDGLLPGQASSVFLFAYQLSDTQYFISKVDERINAVMTTFEVTMIDGADLYDWETYIVDRQPRK